MEDLVRIQDVSFMRNERSIFNHISMTIPAGKITAIMGPSGCGKTTLLRLIGGQLAPSEGSIYSQDEIVFDGGSMVVNGQGETRLLAKFFEEDLPIIDIEFEKQQPPILKEYLASSQSQHHTTKVPIYLERILHALILGLRDYVYKNNFKKVILGVSGGIDSAVTLAIAVMALGEKNVHALVMPSRYTASISMEDGLQLLANYQVTHEIITIEPILECFLTALEPSFKTTQPDVTEENLQARIRGMLLMASSNKFGYLVLTTSNRSELAVGYGTLYGDMAGGFNLLKDIPKTLVYELAGYINQQTPLIPQRIMTRPPSAELAFNQTDQDTLPPYDILDSILFLYLNEEKSIEEIVANGYSLDTVEQVISLIQKNEYKRHQGAPGVRINHRSFGKDRRYPITNGFK